MKLKFIMPALALAVTLSVNADYISPEEALSRVGTHGDSSMAKKAKAVSGVSRTPVRIFNDPQGMAAAYIFADSDRGFMVLSADDEVTPVLGYSDSGKFDADNIPDAMVWWLDNYADQIGQIRRAAYNKIEGTIELPAEWDKVKPLCTTKWSQGDPYNRMTPIHNGSHCATGCVATGMAQACKYWNWPERGTGKITFNVSHIGDLSMDFSETVFDWENMTDTYGGSSTEKQKDAVALLMKACGYASRMWYNVGSSGTQSSYIPGGLKGYLGYHQDTRYEERVNYNSLEWSTLIYDNIVNCGPVVYSGYSNIGEGHCFICDGYDGKGYFHFNWGWGGTSDGYFLLTDLNPYDQGIGGSPGGFRYGQTAVIGMRPPTKEITASIANILSQKSNIHPVINGTAFDITPDKNKNLRWVNAAASAVSGTIGFKIRPFNETPGETKFVELAPFALETGKALRPKDLPDGKMTFDIAAQNLQDGDYQVAVVYKKDGKETWEEVATGNEQYSYCLLTVAGSKYTVTEADDLKVEFDVAFGEQFFYDVKDKVRVTINNSRPGVVTYGIAPAYLDGSNNIIARGEGLMVDVDPGESLTREWAYTFHFVDTPNTSKTVNYYPAIYDPNTYNILWKSKTKVSMTPTPAAKIGKFRIENAEKDKNSVYQVKDLKDVHFYSELYYTDGELPGNLHISIWDKSTNENIANFMVPEYENVEVGAKGLEGNTHVDLSSHVNGHRFLAYLSYHFGLDQWNHLVSRTGGKVVSIEMEFDKSGVEELVSGKDVAVYDRASGMIIATSEEGVAAIDLYDLTGAKVMSTGLQGANAAEISVADLTSGVYIVNIISKDGKSKTMKIAK